MRALELDYLRSPGHLRRPRHILAAVALVFALDAGWQHYSLKENIALRTERLAQTGAAPLERQPARLASPEEYVFARDTIGRLATPWDRLFQALEAAQTEQIALLAIEPDAEHRTVTISGEAKDYLAALTYVASLSAQKALRRVHLTRHETQRGSSARPLAFTISAAWRDEL